MEIADKCGCGAKVVKGYCCDTCGKDFDKPPITTLQEDITNHFCSDACVVDYFKKEHIKKHGY